MAMNTQVYSLPYYDQILAFLAAGPSAQPIVAFRPPPEAQARFSHLLDVNRQRALTAADKYQPW
jgi:hypothetical protein